ncbi:MAG: hypothetical protein IKT07_00735, partial [Oscillospiraceae bacterium]|nr:hypothetical protein [Oscillospiraceae bacterium]
MQAVSLPESGFARTNNSSQAFDERVLSLIHYKKPLGNPMTENSNFPGLSALTEHIQEQPHPDGCGCV